MPLVSIGKELKRAQQGHYAIPLFDASDMQSADGMFMAAEAKRAPVIVAVYSGLMDHPNVRALAAYIRQRAAEATVPVALMLDHGSSFEKCMKAISCGFSDVMFDGSSMPIDENIVTTRAVVRVAHAMGLCIEAEIGHVGLGSEYDVFGGRRLGFTNPDDVERFATETNVDFLAVAIGNAHGVYKGEPQLDIDLLHRIRERVSIPLVMHGGSGLADDQFRNAIAAGMSKINVATDLYLTTTKRLVEAGKAEKVSYFDLNDVAIKSFQERCEYYLDLFGAAGKAQL